MRLRFAREFSSLSPVFRIWTPSRLTAVLHRHPPSNLTVHAFQPSQQPRSVGTPHASTFGYVVHGQLHVRHPLTQTQWTLTKGQYWALPGVCTLHCASSVNTTNTHNDCVFVVETHAFTALNSAGGPVEARGRLRYIDGCSDTVLIPPPHRGDPCLNMLYFPPACAQTAHTHPSIRVGVVADGRGQCLLHDGSPPVQLLPGSVFVIDTNLLHSFRTPNDSHLQVIAFHPNTDTGPTHHDHPMINQTIIPPPSPAT